jgi:serine phosphatase RsbU (regulator of sigma subunit)
VRDHDRSAEGMLADLLGVVGTTALDDLPDTVSEYAGRAAFTEVLIYVGDVERRSLHLLAGARTPVSARRMVPITDDIPGRAYQYGSVLSDGPTPSGGVRYWVPLYNGVERIGVMSVVVARDDEEIREAARGLATLVALAIVTKRGHSDTYARLNRVQPMSVSAEAQWHLIPPRSYADARVAICATLEPAYRISGDVYDYATAGPMVYLSIFDAMGHDTAAGLTATLAVAASRNARRAGAGIPEMGEAVERELADQFDGIRFATAVLACIDTRTGLLSWSSFGHHPPLLVRGSKGMILDSAPAFPLGTGLDGGRTTVSRRQLEPGDRVVLYTDGITEARRPQGRQFGLDRFISSLAQYENEHLSVSETVRRFVHAFLDYHDRELQDDATVLLCEWPGPPTG